MCCSYTSGCSSSGTRIDHHVGFLGGLVHGGDLQAGLFSLRPALGALAQTNAHVNAGVHEVQRMGMALRTVADDGDLLALDDLRIDVVFIVDRNSHGGDVLSSWLMYP